MQIPLYLGAKLSAPTSINTQINWNDHVSGYFLCIFNARSSTTTSHLQRAYKSINDYSAPLNLRISSTCHIKQPLFKWLLICFRRKQPPSSDITQRIHVNNCRDWRPTPKLLMFRLCAENYDQRNTIAVVSRLSWVVVVVKIGLEKGGREMEDMATALV